MVLLVSLAFSVGIRFPSLFMLLLFAFVLVPLFPSFYLALIGVFVAAPIFALLRLVFLVLALFLQLHPVSGACRLVV